MKLNDIFAFLATAVLAYCPFSVAQSPEPPAIQKTATRPLNVAFLVFDGVEVLDLCGPLDVFLKAENLAPRTYRIFTVGTHTGPIRAQDKVLTLHPQFTLQNSPRPDIIVLPGSGLDTIHKVAQLPEVKKWVRKNSSPNQRALSVCTGAYFLGHAGVLDGLQATTHWSALREMQAGFPKTTVVQGVRFVNAGNIITAGGVTSGIDAALSLVAQISGHNTADSVAKVLQYRTNTPVYPELPPGPLVPIAQIANPSVAPGTPLAADYCPICHMKVGANPSITTLYAGKLYGFCAMPCKELFLTKPAQYAAALKPSLKPALEP